MRRMTVITVLAIGLALAGCGGGGTTDPAGGGTPTDSVGTAGGTGPGVRQVVSEQNRQLAELEQRTGQFDPTAP